MNMKIIKIALFCSALFLKCELLNAQWQWANAITSLNDAASGIHVMADGTSYVYGAFSMSCNFPSDTIWSNGVNDLFLAKYDVNGNILWHKQFGGNNFSGPDERTAAMRIDEVNNVIYLSGTFFGSLIIGNDTVNSSTGIDPFLAKLDTSGNGIWVISASCPFSDFDSSNEVCLDNSGNIYWTGILGSNGTLDTTTLSKGTFLTKVDYSGNVLWAKNEFNGAYPIGYRFQNNNIYFSCVTTNDTVVVDTLTFVSNDADNVLIGKMDNKGKIIWVKKFGGTMADYAISMDITPNSNIYISGYFLSDTMFVQNDTLINPTNREGYLAKFDGNGTLLWIKQTFSSGINGGWGKGIVSDQEDVYWIGSFSGNASFGSYSPTANTDLDAFITKYDSSGSCLLFENFGKVLAGVIKLDASKNIYHTGIFYNSLTLGSSTLTSIGPTDFYFAKRNSITDIEEWGSRGSENSLTIYANPNNGSFNIKLPVGLKSIEEGILYIYDNSGKEITKFNLTDSTMRFTIKDAISGMYNLKLVSGNKAYFGKLIVN